MGGYFGLDCSDGTFDKLLKYIVKHVNELDEFQICHKSLLQLDEGTLSTLADKCSKLKKLRLIYANNLGF